MKRHWKTLFLGMSLSLAGCASSTQITPLHIQTWDFQFQNESTVSVVLPHCWNAIDGADGGSTTAASVDGNGYQRGVGNYTTSLKVNYKPNKRYTLRFDGAGIKTQVFINEQIVGEHTGAFGRFAFDITSHVAKSNGAPLQLRVAVDNTFSPDIPPVSGDFTMFGGLYRPVTLIESNETCFDRVADYAVGGIKVSQLALSNEQAILNITSYLCNIPQNAQLRFDIKDREGKTVTTQTSILSKDEHKFSLNLKLSSPHLWQGVEDPYLYTIEATLMNNETKVDNISTKWGFRTFEICREKGPLLNGKPMGKLRGVNRHQDKEGKGWALSPEDERQDIEIMREMGVNAWRAAHYPHSQNMYRMCDEMGIVVWAEIPVVDRVNETDTFFAESKYQLSEMIAQHQNHPSIVMWSISNELGNGPNGQKNKGSAKLMKALFEQSKQEDPTRYCVLAANVQRGENELVELVGFNTYPGWYGGNNPYKGMQGAIQSWCNRYKTKGVCVSEYGAGASIHCHDAGNKQPQHIHPFHPEEWQTHCHEGHLKAIQEAPMQLWGSFVWNMYDFGADNRREGDHMGRNDKGLVTYDRKTRKDAFFMYKACWTNTPVVHLCSSRWTTRPEGKYNFKVFSNCPEIELVINGKSYGKNAQPSAVKAFDFENIDLTAGNYTIEATGFNADGKAIKDCYSIKVTPKQK